MAENMLYFIFHNWFFNNANCREMEAGLSAEEAAVFPLTVRPSPDECTAIFCYGIAKYLAETPNLPAYEEALDAHHKSWKRTKAVNRALQPLVPRAIRSLL